MTTYTYVGSITDHRSVNHAYRNALYYRSICFDWLIGWLIDWLIDWWIDCLINRWIGWLVGWSRLIAMIPIDWLIDWLVDWLIDCIISRLNVWLIVRLIANWLYTASLKRVRWYQKTTYWLRSIDERTDVKHGTNRSCKSPRALIHLLFRCL